MVERLFGSDPLNQDPHKHLSQTQLRSSTKQTMRSMALIRLRSMPSTKITSTRSNPVPLNSKSIASYSQHQFHKLVNTLCTSSERPPLKSRSPVTISPERLPNSKYPASRYLETYTRLSKTTRFPVKSDPQQSSQAIPPVRRSITNRTVHKVDSQIRLRLLSDTVLYGQ